MTENAGNSQGAIGRSWWASLPVLAGGLVLASFSWMPLSYYRMVGWAWILFWQLGGMILALGLWRRLRQGQPFYALGYGLDRVVLTLGVVLGLSAVVSPFPRVALWNASLVAIYAAALYFYRNVVDHGWLNRLRLWRGLVAIAIGTAVVSLALWRPDPTMWAPDNFLTALRNHQPLGHHNFVGGYFALTLPLAVAAAVASRGWRRWLVAAGSGLMVAALYVSGSRGAALGVVVWLLVTWVARLGQVKASQRWRWWLAGLAGAVGLGLLLASNPRIRTWFSAESQIDGPTLDRWFMLRLGGNILRDRPLLGVGPGVMGRVSNLYRPIETG
ncbi:MAG: O-antigen ligase family protein, partial [Cyanobacteria bacterium J06638_6]